VKICSVEFRNSIVRSYRERTVSFVCAQMGDNTEHSQFHMYKVARPRRADLSGDYSQNTGPRLLQTAVRCIYLITRMDKVYKIRSLECLRKVGFMER